MCLDLWQVLVGGQHDERDQLSGFVVQIADRVDIAIREVSQDLHELRLRGAWHIAEQRSLLGLTTLNSASIDGLPYFRGSLSKPRCRTRRQQRQAEQRDLHGF